MTNGQLRVQAGSRIREDLEGDGGPNSCEFSYSLRFVRSFIRHSSLVLLTFFAIGCAAAFGDTSGLVPVGTQPHGGLSGKIVYTHGGHGITADNEKDGRWTFQRGPANEMIEDLGNIDQMAFLVDYLFRAGATIVPLRPVGNQPNEVVLDNDDPGVTFEGDWKDATDAAVYFGKPGHVPYRQAATSTTETARARYTPNIPRAGFYPVYAWTSSGGDRASDQLYRVNHSGGATEVTVNHRRVGNGLVYLGTYYFDAGKHGSVEISNRSNSTKSFVVADMIRFGNGKGDISRGKAGVSKWDRADESGLYWVMWHANRATGVSESDYRVTKNDRQAAISFSPRYAAYMNREADGRLQDRVFVSFHSNAGGHGSKGRGTLGLYNGNNDPTTATPHQKLLASSLGESVNDDMVAQAGKLEHDWYDRHGRAILDRDDIEFGEINNHYINNEFDATIVEVAFHDNADDAQLLLTMPVRDLVARATYKGLLKYFRAVDNNQTPATVLPSPVTQVHAESFDPGSVTVSWVGPKADEHGGGGATSYRVYASTNGYGFDGGTPVPGKDATSAVIKGLDAKTPHYFKVVAVNEGGESEASEVVAALPSGGEPRVLIVNGFDREGRTTAPQQTYAGKTIRRVWPREINSHDYVVQVASAIHAASPEMHIASASNEAVISGAVSLADYKTVVWILGKESTADFTFDSDEQDKVEEFVDHGGNLFVTGSEIAWDLGANDNGVEFLMNTLGVKYAADNADVFEASGAKGGIFDGLKLSFGGEGAAYVVDSPDVIEPQGDAKAALQYAKGKGVAGIQVPGGERGAVVVFGFPFETITTADTRAEVMRRVLEFFGRR